MSALRPPHEQEKAAAQRAMKALDQAEAACAEINASRSAARLAGGSVSNLPAAKLLLPLRLNLRRITEAK